MKVLILESRDLSYGSSEVFLKNIALELEKAGVEVIHVRVTNPEEDSDILESFSGQSFDAVLDMNSILPAAKDGDVNYLDTINAPFINYIVDHPMHVHPYLNVKLKNYYVVCLDRYHKEYIEKYYSHIKGVAAIPLAAPDMSYIGKKEISFEKRKYKLLFPATYTPSFYYLQAMKEESAYAEVLQELDEFLDREKGNDRSDILKFAECFLGENMTKGNAEAMYHLRYLDKFLREYQREKVIDAFLEQGQIVDVVGARWEMYQGKHKDRLRIHEMCGYNELSGMLADAQYVLNVQPFFKQAAHDRIFLAMAAGAIPVTDSCESLLPYENSMLIYDTNYLKESVASVCQKMANFDSNVVKSTEKLKNIICEKENFRERVRSLIEFIGSFS